MNQKKYRRGEPGRDCFLHFALRDRLSRLRSAAAVRAANETRKDEMPMEVDAEK
jgi:hypothetical protein